MSKGKSTQTTDSTSQMVLPQWVQDAGKANYGLAQGIAGTPYDPNMNTTIAGATPDQNAAYGLMQSGVGQAEPMTQNAAGVAGGIANGYTPSQVNPSQVAAGNLATTNLSPYMNPYTNDVIDANNKTMDQNNQLTLNANDARATAAGAFGGSRAAVQDAVTSSQNDMNKATMAANLNNQNYTQAQSAATGDINRNLQAGTTNAQLGMQGQMANQSAGLQGTGMRLNAAGQLVNDANNLQQQNMTDANGLLQSGQLQQQQQQNVDNASTANAQNRSAYKTDQLNTLLSSLGMTPYNKTQTTKGTQVNQSSPDWATSILGAGKLGLGLLQLSDDDSKTDKVKMGKVPGSDLELWSYRYKGDPKTYPKVVGLMASDVEKKVPDAVRRIGKTRVVDYTKALSRVG